MSDFSDSDYDSVEEFFDIVENGDSMDDDNIKKLKHIGKSININDLTQEQNETLSEALVGFAESNEMELLKLFVKMGVKDVDNRAIYFAKEYEHQEVVDYLRKHGFKED